MRGGGGGGGCKPGNSNAMIRAPLPTHSPQSRQRRAPRGAGEARRGERGSHPERVSRGTPRGAGGGLRGAGEGARSWRGGGTRAGEPETASQCIYKPGARPPPPSSALPPRPSRPLQPQPSSSSRLSASEREPRAERSPPPSPLAGVGPCRPPRPAPPPAPRPSPRALGFPWVGRGGLGKGEEHGGISSSSPPCGRCSLTFSCHLQPGFSASEVKPNLLGGPRPRAPRTHRLHGSNVAPQALRFIVRRR